MGCIYKRGAVYWIKYYENGKPHLESTHSKEEAKAERLLKRREGEIAKGELPGIYFDRIRFDEIADDLLTDYRVNKKKSLPKVEIYVRHLKEFFGGARVTEITTARINKFIEKKIGEEYKNATINRELSTLSFMFTLAKKSRKISEVPYVPKLVEDNIRTGFFEHDQFISLRIALPDYLRPVVTFAYYTGWRRSEILNLTWDKVNIKEAIIRLNPGESKNKKGREIYLTGELLSEMRSLHSKRTLGCSYVFNHNGGHIKGFYKIWNPICKKLGLAGKLLHDFRRTAVRNLIRSGVNETVAMRITGHRTRNVFDRYNIVSSQDLKEAAIKHQSFIQSQVSGDMDKEKVIPFRTVTEMVTVAI